MRRPTFFASSAACLAQRPNSAAARVASTISAIGQGAPSHAEPRPDRPRQPRQGIPAKLDPEARPTPERGRPGRVPSRGVVRCCQAPLIGARVERAELASDGDCRGGTTSPRPPGGGDVHLCRKPGEPALSLSRGRPHLDKSCWSSLRGTWCADFIRASGHRTVQTGRTYDRIPHRSDSPTFTLASKGPSTHDNALDGGFEPAPLGLAEELIEVDLSLTQY